METAQKREPHAGATAMSLFQGFVPDPVIPEDVAAILALLESMARPQPSVAP